MSLIVDSSAATHRLRALLARARHIGPAALALLAGLAFAPAGVARDRPGAPIDISSYECWGDPGGYLPSAQSKGPPAICTLATNSAKEKVRFIIRVVANGVVQNAAWLHSHVVVWNTQTSGPVRGEAALTYMLGRPYFATSYHERQAFAIYKLEMDTTYCVSLRTQYDDGVVSIGGTDPPCVRTRKPH